VALLLLLLLWGVLALAQLFWTLWPQPAIEPLPAAVINPASVDQVTAEGGQVDIDALVARHLFGEAGAEVEAATLAAAASSAEPSSREGIEEGARETRLELTLRGVLASTEDGLGQAIIEHRQRQAVYAVEDELPVSGNVKLAKVMPRRVVLENNGTYELLTLYEDSEFDAQLRDQARSPTPAATTAAPTRVDKVDDPRVSALASGYRRQLYENPETLASVVRISAVRDGEQLLGYRVAPGRDAQQFRQLGFEAGDLVTGINGIELNNPANTVQLYQAMRTAGEAVFELQRDGQPVSLRVDLGAAASDQ